MAKPWGILLLVPVAFALGIASNFLLRSLPATATVIQLAAADLSLSVPALVRRLPLPQLLGDVNGEESGSDAGDESRRMVMLHNMTDDELLPRTSMALRIDLFIFYISNMK